MSGAWAGLAGDKARSHAWLLSAAAGARLAAQHALSGLRVCPSWRTLDARADAVRMARWHVESARLLRREVSR